MCNPTCPPNYSVSFGENFDPFKDLSAILILILGGVCVELLGKMKGVLWFVVVSVVVAAWMPLSHCSKKPVGIARKEDIPYIKCQVCEKLAKHLYQQVQNKQAEIAPKKVFFSFLFSAPQLLYPVFVSELGW